MVEWGGARRPGPEDQSGSSSTGDLKRLSRALSNEKSSKSAQTVGSAHLSLILKDNTDAGQIQDEDGDEDRDGYGDGDGHGDGDVINSRHNDRTSAPSHAPPPTLPLHHVQPPIDGGSERPSHAMSTAIGSTATHDTGVPDFQHQRIEDDDKQTSMHSPRDAISYQAQPLKGCTLAAPPAGREQLLGDSVDSSLRDIRSSPP